MNSRQEPRKITWTAAALLSLGVFGALFVLLFAGGNASGSGSGVKSVAAVKVTKLSAPDLSTPATMKKPKKKAAAVTSTKTAPPTPTYSPAPSTGSSGGSKKSSGGSGSDYGPAVPLK